MVSATFLCLRERIYLKKIDITCLYVYVIQELRTLTVSSFHVRIIFCSRLLA